MSYEISITSDAEAFAAGAGQRFSGAELEREQLARVLDGVLKGRYAEHPNHFATVLDDRRRARRRGAADAAARPDLHAAPGPSVARGRAGRAWLARDPDVVGVGAEPETARAIAAAWARRTGGESHLDVSMAMHAASAIEDPRAAGRRAAAARRAG